ncbi:hypothetical protein STEG23_005821 [Scotinomys teguina]
MVRPPTPTPLWPTWPQRPLSAATLSNPSPLEESEDFAHASVAVVASRDLCGDFQGPEVGCVYPASPQQPAGASGPLSQPPPVFSAAAAAAWPFVGQPRKSISSRRNAWGNLSYADLLTKAMESPAEERKSVPYFKVCFVTEYVVSFREKFYGVLRRSRKMGPAFASIPLTCVFLLVGKIFFNDFVKCIFCAFELVVFSFFYSYYSKLALHQHLSAEEQSDRPPSLMAPKKPRSQYSLILTIGRGAFSTVNLAYHHLTRTLVVIKLADNAKSCRQLIQSEVEILQKVRHPNIIRLFEVIETRHRFYVITEYVKGGDLMQQVTEEGRLEEGEAQRVFGQLVSAIKYCHSRDIVHLDLQPDNILLDEEANVKLADFGFATMCRAGTVLLDQCGTKLFNAPEQVLGKGYDGKKVDVWSLGVLLYFITTGYHPFRGSSVEEIEKKITTGSYEFPSHISRQLENLIRQMLTVAPERRPSIEDLQQHPWVTDWDETLSTDSDPDPDILGILSDLGFNTNDVLESLRGNKYDELMGLYLIIREKARKELESDLEYTTSSESVDSSVVSSPILRTTPCL